MAQGSGPGGSTGTGSGGSRGSGNQQGGQQQGGGRGAGAQQGGAGPTGVALQFMPNVLGCACHAIRSPEGEIARIQALTLAAADELALLRQKRPDISTVGFEGAMDQLVDRAGNAGGKSRDAGKERDKIRKDAESLLEEIRKYATIELSDGTKLNPQILGPEFATMGPMERAKAAVELEKKIANGRLIMERLRSNPDSLGNPTRAQISDLMFYLRVQSEKVAGKPWLRGALTLPDDGERIRRWLDKSNLVYSRASSHLKPDQSGYGHGGRGIDFKKEGPLTERLPYGMRTLLFQSFERDGKGRLYLKMETEGARINPEAIVKPEGSPEHIRGTKMGDIWESVRHGWNFIVKEKDESRLDRHGEKYEDLPRSVRDSYDALVNASKSNDRLHDALTRNREMARPHFWQDKQVKNFSVADMQQNLDNFLSLLEKNPSMSPEKKAELAQAANQFQQAAENAWGSDYQKDVGDRVGDEVILRDEHLT